MKTWKIKLATLTEEELASKGFELQEFDTIIKIVRQNPGASPRRFDIFYGTIEREKK